MAKRRRLKIEGNKPFPRFRSLEEESDFWDKHSPLDYGSWKEVSYTDIVKDLKSRSRPKRQLSLRLDPELIGQLKGLARKHGIRYQKLARELLRKGVEHLAGIRPE